MKGSAHAHFSFFILNVMKKRILYICLFCLLHLVGSLARVSAQDSIKRVEGWDFAILPALSYNSDLGFHYGVYGNIYCYGRDSINTFPEYRHLFSPEVSRYTLGQTLVYFLYDSKYLIPNIQTTLVASWQYDPLYPFWGFNGFADPLVQERYDNAGNMWEHYYYCKRQMIHIDATFIGHIKGHFEWVGGLTWWSFRQEDIVDDADNAINSRFADYRHYGLIRTDELGGGNHLEIKGGLSFDTRNHSVVPSKGYWINAFLTGSTDLGRGRYSHLKLNANICQYHPLGKRVVLANQIAFQCLLAGEQPYYFLPRINVLYMRQTSSEGLGGMNTLRGLPANRMSGNGYLWANTELRIRIVDFDAIKRHFYLAVNPLFDIGLITQPFRLSAQEAAFNQNLHNAYSTLYTAVGIGGKIVMNNNFVLGVEIAKVINNTTEKYPLGINFGLNYIF